MGWRDLTRQVIEACKGAFGEEITYTSIGQSPITLTAIIDENYESVDPATGATIISMHPMIGLKITDMPIQPQKGDTCVVRGTTYQVIEMQTDGQAAHTLILHKP